MQPTVLHVFVSSTWLDLQPERAVVETALQRLRETKFVGMEYFGSRDEDTRRASLDEVDQSQVYVGIFGGRYGSGITEAEYRRARELGLPCFIYLKDEAAIPPEGRETEPEKAALLAELRAELLQHYTVSIFNTPDDLAARMTADLHRWLFDEYLNQVFVGDYERLRDVYIKPWSVFERVRLDRFVGREWLISEVNSFLQDNDRGYFVLEAGAGLGKTTFLAHLAQEQGCVHHFVELAPGPDGIAPGLKNLAAQLVRAWELNPHSVDEVLPGTASRPDFLQNLLLEAARRRDEIKPGEKIVLVVDALDEAGVPSGQNVLGLPRVLPEGVYFIVSQRPVAVPLRMEGPRRVFHLEAEGEANLADMRAYLEIAATWAGVTRALAEKEYTPAQFVETLLRKCRGVWIYLHYMVGEIERGERSPLDLEALPEDVWQYYAQYWGRWRERDNAAWYSEVLPLLSTLAAAQEALPLPQLCTLGGVTERPGLGRLLREVWRPFLAVDNAEDGPRYRLYHASLREFLDGRTDLTRLKEAERSLAGELAEATRQAHTRIADRYLAAWGGLEAVWRGLRKPERRDIDGRYGLRHLTNHLERAGRATDLHRLLQLEWVQEEAIPYTRRDAGSWLDRLLSWRQVHQRRTYGNVWYTAREGVGDTDGYLADVERAWRLAEEVCLNSFTLQMPLKTVGEGEVLGLQIRYALIVASFNSLAKNIPPALLIALVERDAWTLAQGLAYARHMPDPVQQAKALAGLAPHLPEPMLHEAQAAAQAMEDKGWRALAMAWLSPHLPEPLRGEVLREALAAARVVEDEWRRALVLTGLSPHLPESLRGEVLREALAAARVVEDERWRALVLARLSPHLSEPLREEVLREALAAAWAVERAWERIERLSELIPHMPEPMLNEVLAAVQTIEDERWRAEALSELAPYLPESMSKEALAAARPLQNADARALALVCLLPHLPKPLRRQVQQEALAAAQVVEDKRWQVEALSELIPHLPEPLRGKILEEALETARVVEDEGERAEALSELVPHLPESLRRGILQEALAAARMVEYRRERAEALSELVPHLPEPLRGEVLQEVFAAHAIRWGDDQAEALVELALLLPEPMLHETLAAAQAIKDKKWQVKALVGLASYLPESLLQETVTAVREVLWGRDRRKALAELAPHLSEPMPHEALTARRSRWESVRVWILTKMASHLLGPLLRLVRAVQLSSDLAQWLADLASQLAELGYIEEALAAARTIEDREWRARALAGLISYLPEAERAETVEEALAAAKAIQDKVDRAWWLGRLASQLAELGCVEDALAAARTIEDEQWRANALVRLISHLPEAEHAEVVEEALAAVQAIRDKDDQAWWLAKLAPNLPQAMVPEALAAARAIGDEDKRAEALAGLADRLAQLPPQHLYPLWQETLHFLATNTRKDLLLGLGALSPVIATLGGPEAAVETFRAIQDVGHWWP